MSDFELPYMTNFIKLFRIKYIRLRGRIFHRFINPRMIYLLCNSKQLALMRISNQSSDHFNSIDRDLIIVFVTGFVLAIAIVLAGIVVINQI